MGEGVVHPRPHLPLGQAAGVVAVLGLRAADPPHRVVACIGPVTAATAREYGLEVHVEPAEHTIPALVEAAWPGGEYGDNPGWGQERLLPFATIIILAGLASIPALRMTRFTGMTELTVAVCGPSTRTATRSAAGALSVMVVCYSWLSLVMLKGIVLGNQWRSNPVAVATFAIFLTTSCPLTTVPKTGSR